MPGMATTELTRAARTAVEVCLGVRAGEEVVVVADTLRPRSVPDALVAAATEAGADAVLAVFRAREQSPSEPPPSIAEAMCRANATILYTTASLSHSQARIRAQQQGTRVISAPGLSEEGFLRTLSVDVPRLADLTARLAEAVARSRAVHLRTRAGTDIEMQLAHPVTIADGLCHADGDLDFFPPGLILSVPVTGSLNGTAVVDGSITHIGRLTRPVTLEFQHGRATAIRGGAEAGRLRRMLDALDDPNVYEFAAWGIGTNPNAALIGDDPSFEGERVYGWAHLSTGSNAAFPGGTVRAKLHLDLILTDPIVEVDGRIILEQRTFHV
jgi:leucyl aminopeptidase (aminopeptidase T)